MVDDHAFPLIFYPGLYWAVQHVIKEPCHTSSLSGKAWVTELLHGNPRRFRNQMRMQRETFSTIIHIMLEKGVLGPSRHVSVEEKFAIFLYVVGQNASNRQTQERFQRSGWTITK